jgi:hypothetical protein
MADNRRHLANLNNLQRVAQRQRDLAPQVSYGQTFKKPKQHAATRQRPVKVNKVVELICQADEEGNIPFRVEYGRAMGGQKIFFDEFNTIDWDKMPKMSLSRQPNIQNILETIQEDTSGK